MTTQAFLLGQRDALRSLGLKLAEEEEGSELDEVLKERLREEILGRRMRKPMLAGMGIGAGVGGLGGALAGGLLGGDERALSAVGGGLAGSSLGAMLGMTGGAIYGRARHGRKATEEAEKGWKDIQSGKRKNVNFGFSGYYPEY